jgi:hypothetical protein
MLIPRVDGVAAVLVGTGCYKTGVMKSLYFGGRPALDRRRSRNSDTSAIHYRNINVEALHRHSSALP